MMKSSVMQRSTKDWLDLEKPSATVSVVSTEMDEMTPPTKWKPTARELALMLSLGIISLMISLDATIVVTSLSSVVTALDVNTTQGFWIGTSYLLSSAVCMPFLASISDIFGRAPVLLASLLFFTGGTLLCCLTSNIAPMIIGRCVQGVGGGGIVISSLVIYTDIVPLRFRSQWYGIIQGFWAIGTCIGPIIGGLIVQHTTWRWIFYVMLPFCGIGLITIPFTLRMTPRPGTLWSKLCRVDWLGAIFFIASSTAFLVAISAGGTQNPWDSWQTLVPLGGGVIGMGVTVLWEIYGAKHPFLRRELWHDVSTFANYFGTLVNGFIIYGALYYIPIYFLGVQAHDAVQTGIDLLPTALALAPTSVVAGIFISKFGKFRWAIYLGWILTIAATGCFWFLKLDTQPIVWIELLALLGVGAGLVLNSTNFAAQAIALPGDEGAAAAMYAFMRSFGMALGVGISGTVFQNAMKAQLSDLNLNTSVASEAEAFIQMMAYFTPTDAAPYRQSYVTGVQATNILFCGLAGLALLASVFIKEYGLDRELSSDHRLQGAEKPVSLVVEERQMPEKRPIETFEMPFRDSHTTNEIHRAKASVYSVGTTLTRPSSAHTSYYSVAKARVHMIGDKQNDYGDMPAFPSHPAVHPAGFI